MNNLPSRAVISADELCWWLSAICRTSSLTQKGIPRGFCALKWIIIAATWHAITSTGIVQDTPHPTHPPSVNQPSQLRDTTYRLHHWWKTLRSTRDTFHISKPSAGLKPMKAMFSFKRILHEALSDKVTGINLLTYLLTPWCRILFEKLTFTQLVKNYPPSYGTRGFITAFTKACHRTLSWARRIQFAPSIPISIRSI
jgi:hypothetical protein